MGDNVVNKIRDILKRRSNSGLTITELVGISELSRSAVRTALAKMEGAGKVSIRKVGMAKIYSLNSNSRMRNQK